MKYVDCLVIGGGAAGLMCAANAGYRGLSVAVLDHANKVGKKILMSGGGRCNFTNYEVTPEHYISGNEHFCISALSRYTQYDFLALVSKYDLAYHEKTLGQLFCDNKAQDILNILLEECREAKVDIQTHCSISRIEHLAANNGARFRLETGLGIITCRSLVVATGGLSIPSMGASGFGYDIAKQFGLAVTPCCASLVALTVKGALLNTVQSLAGIAIPAKISSKTQSFSEALLFTHKGLSGPAILQISNYWHLGDTLVIDFLPDQSLSQLIEQWQCSNNKTTVKNLLSRYLPKRFVQTWLSENKMLVTVLDKPIADYSAEMIDELIALFHHWSFVPTGTEGYKTAEVTRGGVDTANISSKTFEATSTEGLFFIGEVLDVTGWLGGYNFQWAWASGYCASQYV